MVLEGGVWASRGDSQFPDPNLDGALDDFRISCRAYAAAEITAMLQ